ncbi:hypothetical protein Leryth_027533 [Lithospermum erythrorhizon]|nr:hypothetical protein Leryth_027533 [Lithospermum erythrorhizon]
MQYVSKFVYGGFTSSGSSRCHFTSQVIVNFGLLWQKLGREAKRRRFNLIAKDRKANTFLQALEEH